MSCVVLVSGGLDSTLVARLGLDIGLEQFPLFVDYGQRARHRELAACKAAMASLGLPEPVVAAMPGFGALICSGLTDESLDLVDDAFTPGRNLLFLLLGAAHAAKVGANSVALGLLHEDSALFPDQTQEFADSAQRTLSIAIGRPIRVLLPLAEFRKRDVVELAKQKGLNGTYSCHAGTESPCGVCISCREFQFEKGGGHGR
jgi:7-cyano-7-deazaguanine synthase